MAIARIAEALGVTAAKLVEGLDQPPKLSITSREEGVVVERDRQVSDIICRSIGFDRLNRRMDPFVLTIQPGGGRTDIPKSLATRFGYFAEKHLSLSLPLPGVPSYC